MLSINHGYMQKGTHSQTLNDQSLSGGTLLQTAIIFFNPQDDTSQLSLGYAANCILWWTWGQCFFPVRPRSLQKEKDTIAKNDPTSQGQDHLLRVSTAQGFSWWMHRESSVCSGLWKISLQTKECEVSHKNRLPSIHQVTSLKFSTEKSLCFAEYSLQVFPSCKQVPHRAFLSLSAAHRRFQIRTHDSLSWSYSILL